MRRAAIVTPLRTPVGRFGGALKDVPVERLGATVVNAILDRTSLDPARVDDVVFAQSYANSETPCVGRWVALEAGLPVRVPGMQLDRRCGGGLQSIATAAMMVQSGACDVVIAGGVESMSNIEHYTTGVRWGTRSGSPVLYDRLDRGRESIRPHRHLAAITDVGEQQLSPAGEPGGALDGRFCVVAEMSDGRGHPRLHAVRLSADAAR